jgi:hypothetical protein
MTRSHHLWKMYGLTIFTVEQLRVDVFVSFCRSIDKMTGDADG